MEDSLDQILRKGLGMMVWQAGQLECEICGFYGVSSPATRRVLGKDACDQCAKELEGSLQIGPAIWLVSVSDGKEYEGYEEADYGAVDCGHRWAGWRLRDGVVRIPHPDYGAYTLGWHDRKAAEAYARQAGAEVREAFIVEVVGGDWPDALGPVEISEWWMAFDEKDALKAVEISDWLDFDGTVAVAWPHADEDGLRRRLLYGTNA